MSFRKNLAEFARLQFAPPRYLSLPTAGIDLSANAIKVVTISEHPHGLELSSYKDIRLPPGVITGGDIIDKASVIKLLSEEVSSRGVSRANLALPESRGYLFEATVDGATPAEWRTSLEQHIDEFVPLPPAEVVFDSAPLARDGERMHLVGVGYARRIVEESLAIFESAGISARSFESETFALPRALLPHGDTETVLIIDIGKTSTKLLVVSKRLPRLATTLDIGGHALTLAVQKYFGVTEEEAKKVKAERGLVPGPDNDEYIASMLSTVSAIREEIVRRIDYWDSRKTAIAAYEPITRAILVGGNATVRGLPEYLETALKIPVELGDVFKNFAPRAHWLPPIDYMESLAFGTAIGLALREYVPQ
jgi:type IV pilus assembly protein PilM